jgi:hypothetical protein
MEEVANGVAKLVMNNKGSSTKGVTTTHDAPIVDKVRVDATSLNNTSDVRDGASPIETRNQCKKVDDNICKLDIEYVTSDKNEDRYTRGKSPPSPP